MRNNIVINFFSYSKINFVDSMYIIACKLELFKNPIIDFINQEISAEREISIT
jgi:hypothetical protein